MKMKKNFFLFFLFLNFFVGGKKIEKDEQMIRETAKTILYRKTDGREDDDGDN